MNADLVLLSACNVGHDAIVDGEGMLGLVRAFMAAGAPRVMASLWPADDAATVKLMTAFHEAIRKGASNFEALRAAQASVRDTKDGGGNRPWSHPYDWAGWVLWGLAD